MRCLISFVRGGLLNERIYSIIYIALGYPSRGPAYNLTRDTSELRRHTAPRRAAAGEPSTATTRVETWRRWGLRSVGPTPDGPTTQTTRQRSAPRRRRPTLAPGPRGLACSYRTDARRRGPRVTHTAQTQTRGLGDVQSRGRSDAQTRNDRHNYNLTVLEPEGPAPPSRTHTHRIAQQPSMPGGAIQETAEAAPVRLLPPLPPQAVTLAASARAAHHAARGFLSPPHTHHHLGPRPCHLHLGTSTSRRGCLWPRLQPRL